MHIRYKHLVFLTFGLSGLLFSGLQAQDLETAISYTRSERFDLAETEFQELVQAEPGNSKAYYFYGENILLDYFADSISNSLTVTANKAREIYNRGIESDPSNPLNYIGLAKIAFLLEEDDESEQLRVDAKSKLPPYKKVTKIKEPVDYAFALAKIAESYIRGGEVDTSKALPLLKEALMIDRTNPDIYIIKGDVYNLINDHSTAISNYNLAQDYDFDSPTANMKIGSIYARGQHLMVAIPYYEQAISIDANYAPAYRELGQLYSMAGRYDQSKEYFKKYLEITAGNVPAKIRYVNALYYAKEHDEVIKTVDEILEVDQSRPYLNRIAAYACYEKKDYDLDRALQYMESLFRSLPAENLIKRDYLYLAKILLKKNLNFAQLEDQEKINAATKEIERAFEAYHDALEFDQDDIRLLNEIANNYYAFKKYEDAARTWECMLGLGKDDLNDYLQVGRVYYMAENYTKADSVFKMIVSEYPDNIMSYLMIARIHAKMDPESTEGLARPKFEQLLEKASADSITNAQAMVEGFGYLGYFHLRKGQYRRADAFYDRMINISPDNTEFKKNGYSGKANVWFMMSENAKELDDKIPYFDRSIGYYDRVLEMDPDNSTAKSSKQYIMDVRRRTRANINPDELRGVIKSSSGQPINGASVRVKDTAAETITNARGEFRFQIPMSSEALIISAGGYISKEVPITRTRVYNEVLEPE